MNISVAPVVGLLLAAAWPATNAEAETAAVVGAAKAAAPAERCYEREGRVGCAVVSGRPAPDGRRPLILFLHGYGGDGREEQFGLAEEAERAGAVYAFAQGLPASTGGRSWPSIAALARKEAPTAAADDAAFLDWLIDRLAEEQGVDRDRVALVGWSQGGILALHHACRRDGRIAAVMTFAGALPLPIQCAPRRPVSVLLVHGDADRSIDYAGGVSKRTGLPYASAHATFEAWARADGCGGRPEAISAKLDLHRGIPFAESSRLQAKGCPRGTEVELWTIEGGGHEPALSREGKAAIARFLLEPRR